MTDPLNRAPTTALQKPRSGLPPLPGTDAPLQYVDWYVDSVAGNDETGQGTEAAPWRTLQRAWFQRQQWLVLRVVARIHLVGVGPYDMPPMGLSECAENGYFFLMGDDDAETVVTTGTATGDLPATCILPTSATGGTDNLRNEFLRMTSGACAGAVFQINSNTANTITVANRYARNTQGAILNGDTWEVVRPGTQLRISGALNSDSPHIITDWIGSGVVNGVGSTTVRHWLYNLRLVTADASSLRVNGATLGFCMVRAERGVLFANSHIQCGVLSRGNLLGIGTSGPNDLLAAAGLVCVTAGGFSLMRTQLNGVVSSSVTGFGIEAGLELAGGCFAAFFATAATRVYFFGGDTDVLLTGTMSLMDPGTWFNFYSGAGVLRAVVTAGNVFTIQGAAQAMFGAAATGGTSAGAGYGVDVRGGGRCLFRGVTPALTGGTAGSDLRTTNVAVAANAVLNANNTSVATAADALVGEQLARLAA